MNFLETLKRDADAKYSEMLSGETKSPIETVDIASTTKFVEKNKAYHSRLESEAKQLSQSLNTVEKNKQSRLKLEELKRKQAKEAEEERKRQQKEEQERQRREAARREAERAAKKKKMIFACVALAVAVAIVIAIIAGVASSNKKKEEAARQEELNYGCSHISLEIKSKTNGEQSYNYYTTNFRIVVKNECQVKITYLVCDLKVSAADNGTELWKGDVRLTGDIPAGGNATWDVDLKTTGNQIWSYPLEGLTIQCKFVSAQFDDYTSKDYSDTYKTVHSGNSNYKNNLYQQAKNYYNQGKYQEAYDIFVSLGSYSDCETWADKCNEKIAEQSRLESLNAWKQYLSYVGSNIPTPSTIEYWGTPNTATTWYEGSDRNGVSCGGYIYNTANGLNFVSDFKSELIAAGYTEVTDGSNYNDLDYYYKKGNIVVGFNDPIANYYDYYVYMVAFNVS